MGHAGCTAPEGELRKDTISYDVTAPAILATETTWKVLVPIAEKDFFASAIPANKSREKPIPDARLQDAFS